MTLVTRIEQRKIVIFFDLFRGWAAIAYPVIVSLQKDIISDEKIRIHKEIFNADGKYKRCNVL